MRTVNNSLLKEFTAEEINRPTCKSCQCAGCKNDLCPVPCRANVPCEAPVTRCPECK